MKDIQKIYSNCKAKLDAIGIETGEVISVVSNSRATSRWGLCKRVGSKFIIEISVILLEDDVSDFATESTMLHELLHTCKYCQNHGNEWKNLAARVNAKYGYNIKRTTSYEELGIQKSNYVEDAKHKITCKSCGHTIYRKRESNLIKHTERYRCLCGGEFKLEY